MIIRAGCCISRDKSPTNYNVLTGNIIIREPAPRLRLPAESCHCGDTASVTITSRYQDIANGSPPIRSSGGKAAGRALGAGAWTRSRPCQRVLQKLEINIGGSTVTASIGGGGDPAMTRRINRDMNIDVVHIGLVIRCPGFPEPPRIGIIVGAPGVCGKNIIASATAVCWVDAPESVQSIINRRGPYGAVIVKKEIACSA